MSSPIFTNNALTKMSKWHLSETQILDVFNFGEKQDCIISKPGFRQKCKKYNVNEIGVIYFLDSKEAKIISAWKRNRY